MTDEEKKAADAKAAAEAEEKTAIEKSDEEEVEEKSETKSEGDSKDSDNDVDYKADLEIERQAREKAEKALARKRFNESNSRRKGEAEDDEDEAEEDEEEEGKPLTASDLQRALEAERRETQKQVQAARIEEIAKRISQSDAQRELIIEIHKNRTFPAHLSLEDQLEEAYAIANRKKTTKERDEAFRALKGKNSSNADAATTHRSGPAADEPKIPSNDATAIKAAGFNWNGQTRRYEKKLANGSTLVRDSKSGKTFLIKKAS